MSVTVEIHALHAADLKRVTLQATNTKRRVEILILRAKADLLEAEEARDALIDELAETYGFDKDRPFTVDGVTLLQD